MKLEIRSIYGSVLFTSNLPPEATSWTSAVRLGYAVKYAFKNRVDLQGADLRGAKNLEEANDWKLAIARTRILPEGDIIGWKKCNNNVIVKMLIPASAGRSHAFGRKCRAEYVQVLEVHGAEFGVTSAHGPRTEYRVGQIVRPSKWSLEWQIECAPGIHFYITREEAEAH